MRLSSAEWIEISMMASGALGLLVLLAPAFGRKPKQAEEVWQFPVKLSCLLVYWLGFAAGICAVAYAGRRLLASAGSNWSGWACFAFGFALVLLVLSNWPGPLILDREGLLKQGSPSSRIRWQELSYVRQYQVRNDRGVVIHGVYGQQLVVTDLAYDSAQVLDTLLELRPLPFHSLEDPSAPISILTVPLQRP